MRLTYLMKLARRHGSGADSTGTISASYVIMTLIATGP